MNNSWWDLGISSTHLSVLVFDFHITPAILWKILLWICSYCCARISVQITCYQNHGEAQKQWARKRREKEKFRVVHHTWHVFHPASVRHPPSSGTLDSSVELVLVGCPIRIGASLSATYHGFLFTKQFKSRGGRTIWRWDQPLGTGDWWLNS